MNTISVIVSKCVSHSPGHAVLGERLFNTPFSTLDAAQEMGEIQRGKGKSVVVRPNYNETDADGTFYREWRSFDGRDFEECRWRVG